ncbi:hypothetical protein Hanom_Chr11g00998421 [Helianthus anomalus]
MRVFEFWTKMATKCKPQGPKFKKFEILTKMAKLPKPQGPKWQFTQNKKNLDSRHSTNKTQKLLFYPLHLGV